MQCGNAFLDIEGSLLIKNLRKNMSFGVITPMLHDAPCMEYLPTFNIPYMEHMGDFKLPSSGPISALRANFNVNFHPPSVIGHVALSENMMP